SCASGPVSDTRRSLPAAARLGFALLAAVLGAGAAAQAPPPAGFPGRAPSGPPAEILSFSAEPASIEPGRSATLRWEVVNAFALSLAPGVGPVATRGWLEVSPAATTVYTLTVTGTGGQIARTATVRVAGSDPAPGAAAEPPVAAERPVPRLPDG